MTRVSLWNSKRDATARMAARLSALPHADLVWLASQACQRHPDVEKDTNELLAQRCPPPAFVTGVGGVQRTPFWDDGPPVFSACERLGFGMAAGRSTGCRDEPFNICMESTTLHAYIEVRIHSLCR